MKKFFIFILGIAMLLTVTGCVFQTSETYSLTMGDGETVNIKLDTVGGYDITAEIPFTVTKGEQVTCTGKIQEKMTCTEIQQNIQQKEAENIRLIETSEKDGNPYIFYEQDNTFWYVVLIHNSGYVVILANKLSEESARETFGRMEITSTGSVQTESETAMVI